LRKKTWQVIRKRVPGVTQAVVTRTLYKLGDMIEVQERWTKRKRA
jgi:hypothetical protein